MTQVVTCSSTLPNEPLAFVPKQHPPPTFHHPIRLIKLECRQNDDKLVQELRDLLDDGLLYLDPYLKLRLGSQNSWVDVVLRSLLCSIPLIRSNTTIALEQQHLYLLDKNGKRLSLIRKALYLVLKIYLPALRSWLERCWPALWRLYSSPLMQTIVSGGNFLNFAWFLSVGGYPTLVDRLCGVSIVQAGSRRRFQWPLPRQLVLDFYGAAVVSAIRILPWRQIVLITRSVLSVIPPRRLWQSFLPEIPTGNCPVCGLCLNYPCHLQCGHAVCYWCLESSCRLPWTAWIFCPSCIKVTREVSGITR